MTILFQADTYGMDEFDAQQFAKSHLGARLDFKNDDFQAGAGNRYEIHNE